MPIRKILSKTPESLRPSAQVMNWDDPYVRQAIQDLQDTLIDHQKELDRLFPGKGMGVGLASNQIEYPYQPESKYDNTPKSGFYPKNFIPPRIYVVYIRPERAKIEKCDVVPLTTYINASFRPVAEQIDEKPRQISYEEGCLSISGVKGLGVPRYDAIEILAWTPGGEKIQFLARGFIARVHQHEIDHGLGKEYLNQMSLTYKELTQTLAWIEKHRLNSIVETPAWIIADKLQAMVKNPDLDGLQAWVENQLQVFKDKLDKNRYSAFNSSGKITSSTKTSDDLLPRAKL